MEKDYEADWDTLDRWAEARDASWALELMRELINADPEGAARRASGQPQYDQDRFALAAPAALRDCE